MDKKAQLSLTNPEVTYELSIDTKIDDLGWAWICYKVNFIGFRDFGRQNG